jgi:hypothetical protein
VGPNPHEGLAKVDKDGDVKNPRRSQGTLIPSSVNPRYRIRGTNV